MGKLRSASAWTRELAQVMHPMDAGEWEAER
jgi:hypothetical protein